MERENRTEAKKVVLAPVDTRQLKAIGCKVTRSVITAGVMVDEKEEMQGIRLTKGKEVKLLYIIDGRPASTTYSVVDVQPPHSCVGIQTAVEILSRKSWGGLLSSPDRTFGNGGGLLSGPVVRSTLQEWLEFMEADLALAEQEGLLAGPLEAQISVLRASLGTL